MIHNGDETSFVVSLLDPILSPLGLIVVAWLYIGVRLSFRDRPADISSGIYLFLSLATMLVLHNMTNLKELPQIGAL